MTQLPDLTLRIGVTGHRPNKLNSNQLAQLSGVVRRLVADLRSIVDEFSRLAAVSSAGSARLEVVSALAEGADRMVAKLALDQGADLVALLPFAREDYVLDFSGSRSRTDFHHLLENANEIVELDGRRDTEVSKKSAYACVGALVVERSDMLIALWDGESASGTGGTAQVIELAKHSGRPVFWLPTSIKRLSTRSISPCLLLGDDIVRTEAAEAFCVIAKDVLARRLREKGVSRRPSYGVKVCRSRDRP
jgi:hypothetical protein